MDREQYNQFDGFFKEAAANEAGPVMPEGAWQQMEARLDGEKKRRRFIIWWWWLGASVFIAGGLSFFMWKFLFSGKQEVYPAGTNSKTLTLSNASVDSSLTVYNAAGSAQKYHPTAQDQGAVQNNRQKTTTRVSVKAPGTHNANPGSNVNQDASTTSKGLSTGRPIATTADPGEYKKRISGDRISSYLQRPDTHARTAGRLHSAGKGTGQSRKKAGQERFSKSDAGAAEMAITNLPVDEAGEVAVAETSVVDSGGPSKDSLPLKKDSGTNTLVKTTDSLKPATKPVQVQHEKKTIRPTHFYVFAGGAPEWTFVSGRGAGAGSIAYGGGFGYALNSRWAVQTGLVRSGKKYSAGEGDYRPKPGSYYDNPNIKIESVDANCAVWEIPLSIRYVFSKRSRSDFFAVASLQSAIMKRETYDYDYKRYGNPAYSSHTYRTNAFNLFSGFGIAAGYERIVSKQFSMLAMPYFNFPLKGIGEGRINLHSYGLQIGLKYNLPF